MKYLMDVQERLDVRSRWHRKSRRFRPVSMMMTTTIAVTVTTKKISMPLG